VDLKEIYRNLTTRIVFEKRQTEVTALFSAAAAGLALISVLLSLLWFNRVL
jgi:Ca-activated chloride channel family protein